ncbi:unnamed protein product [Closterium sp. NIES-54]
MHDPDPDGICKDCHMPIASTSTIAGGGLAAIAEAEREAPPEEGMSNLELEITTRGIFGTEERPLPGPASQHLQGMLRGIGFPTFFEGCSPSPLLPSVASAAAADLGGFESVGAASAPSGRRRTGRGKGGKGTGGTGGGGGGGGGGSGGGWGGGVEFPPTEAPLQTLHMDVWGPARVRGQGHERYFLLVVDDYSRYTMVFPLRSKGDVAEVLIDWIRAARLQRRESFGSDFPVLRLHSDRGGEFSSARLGAFCRAQGIRQTFTLPASPQQNGIIERRIGMVMDVARTSMIHAAAPHFLWAFAVQYAAHQLNLQPRVSLQETSPTLRWTGKVGDASAFRVWGSRAFVRDLSADKLSPRAVPCVFLGFPPDAPGCPLGPDFQLDYATHNLAFAGVFYPPSAYLVPACSLQVLVRLRRELLG